MPKNEVVSTQSRGSSIALRLFYKNPYAKSELDEYAQEVQSFTQDELYGAQCVEITCGLKSTGLANITYINGLLIIRTDADIDILLSGHSPAYGIHVETKGGCSIVGGPPLSLPVGMYIKSNRTIVDLPISTTGFISFISNYDSDSWVKLDFPVTADKLLINTPNLLFKSKLLANYGGIQCKKLKVAKGGKIHLKYSTAKSLNFDDLDPETASDRSVYLIWKQQIETEIFNSVKSFLKTEKLIYEGDLVLENAILEIKDKVHFSPGCKIELNNVDVFACGVHIDIDSIVSGSDTKFYLKENFDVHGTCNIDGLVIYSDTYFVPGLLWGGKSMHLQIRENASCHGIVGSEKTTIKGKHLLLSAISGNEPLLYKTFVNGGIIGTSSLITDVLSFVRTGGAYLYSPDMYLSGGVSVGLFSYIRRYNLVKNFIYEYNSLEIEMICMPEYMSDLINPNKLLRVAEMIGSKFPILRGLVSAYNVAAFVGPICMSTLVSVLTSIRNDPNPLRQMEYLVSYGMSTAKSEFGAMHKGINSVINLAMGEWNANKLKELVDILLRANGMRVYGNALMSQLTNTLVFVNDVQNHLTPTPNLIINAPKTTTSDDEIKSHVNFIKESLTVVKKITPDYNKPIEENVNLIDATKNVVSNEVSRVAKAPISLYKDVIGVAEAIVRIDPIDSATKVFESYSKQVDVLMSAGRAVINTEPSTVPIQWPSMNEAFIWGAAKESAKLLAPSTYSTSFISDEGGLSITGNYIVNTMFYRNRGIVIGLGTSVHSIVGSNNSGIMLSKQHIESTGSRNNSGIVRANEVRLDIDDNNEHGITEATARMIFDIKNQYIARGAKFKSTGQTFGHISGKMINHGQQDLRNGHLKHEGTTDLGIGSDTVLRNMTLDLDEDFVSSGKVDIYDSVINGKKSAIFSETSNTILNKTTMQLDGSFEAHGKADISNSTIAGKKSAVFAATSDTHTNNVLLNFSTISREDGSKFTIENVLSLNGTNVRSDLNSTLEGTANSLLHIKSNTLDELGTHNVRSGVYDISNMDSESAHRLAFGLAEHQNKTYAKSVFVATENTEDLMYKPIARTDGASATLLTRGSFVLPTSYQRAQGLRFSTYAEAERFVAGYDGYGLPEIPGFKKSISQNIYEEVTAGSAAAVSLGVGAFVVGSGSGLVVAAISLPIGLYTGHKARKAARKEQARINDEITRRTNLHRDIDQRLTVLDEKTDLVQLYNSHNSSMIDDLYQNLGVYSNSSVVRHSLTTQNMLQYQNDIKAIYEDRRLDVSRYHDERANKISKYISDRAQQIRESLGFNISAGVSTKFGADGYTVSGTYGSGVGGNVVHGSVPLYDKTYACQLPCQNPIELPSKRDQIYQSPDLLPVIHDDIISANNDSNLFGAMYQDLGMKDVSNRLHSAISQLHNNDYLTSPGFQYGIREVSSHNKLEFTPTDSRTILFSSSSGGRHLLYDAKNGLCDATKQLRSSQIISYKDKIHITDKFIANLEHELMQIFTSDEKSIIRQQLKITQTKEDSVYEDPEYTISVKGGVIDLGSRKIYKILPNHINAFTSVSYNPSFAIYATGNVGYFHEPYAGTGTRSFVDDLQPVSKTWSYLKSAGKIGFGAVGQILTLAISPANIARDDCEDQPFKYSELDYVDVYHVPGKGAPRPQLPTRFISPALTPDEANTAPFYTPARPRARDGNIVSEYGSAQPKVNFGPLITPIFERLWHNELYRSSINRPNAPDRDKRYHTPPDTIPFEGAKLAKPKGNRKRWRLNDGRIAEWDRQHGEIEMYDKKGHHIGVFSPVDGSEIKPKVSGRKIEI